MDRRRRIRIARAGALLTLAWLATGTLAFVAWQRAEDPSSPNPWPASFEAALLTAFCFWVLAGIAYGIIRWIVTGRGPRA